MAVTKEILSLAVETGDALLRNGAEVYRVEDTVMHILKAYEIEEYDVYVLSNGIFASANEKLPLPRPQKKTSVHLLQVGIALHSSKRVHASFREHSWEQISLESWFKAAIRPRCV